MSNFWRWFASVIIKLQCYLWFSKEKSKEDPMQREWQEDPYVPPHR